ncbi:MAG TPA: hypothetical protein ENK57_03145, partial [Polyangiaceae bacterium]|nr:hypothetical protein [Polyangiaceae bacterium]
MKAKPLGRDGRVVSTKEGYDRWAKVYESDGNPLTMMEEPVVAMLLGEVAELDVLDLGCGTGRHSLPLSEAGARVRRRLLRGHARGGAQHGRDGRDLRRARSDAALA